MRKPGKTEWLWTALAACALAATFAGCVAVNVGRPEVFTHTDTIEETAEWPERSEVENVRVLLKQREERVSVGLAADVREEYRKTRREESAVVRKQKRLGMGLFPGASEYFCMPDGALVSGVLAGSTGKTVPDPEPHVVYDGEGVPDGGSYVLGSFISVLLVPVAVLTWPFGTLQDLLFWPFSSWNCSHDFLAGSNTKKGRYGEGSGLYYDVAAAPELRQLQKFTPEERKRMGLHTCYDLDGPRGISIIGFMFGNLGHFGIAGFHKHAAFFVEPPSRGATVDAGVEVRKRQVEVRGPYVVELSIPAVEYKRALRVPADGPGAVFDLPSATRDGVAAAMVAFREDTVGDGAPAVTRGALEKTVGKTYRFDVELKAVAAPPAAGRPEPRSVEVPSVALTPPPPPSGARPAYEIVGIRRTPDGRYEVRVRVADRSRTFDIGTAVEPDVKRRIREDYASRHPETGIQYVREIVEWETEEEGAVLVYRGWAFAAQPMAWRYDAQTRRGTVRLNISREMSAEDAKRWARENISAVVADKNVGLAAGEAPPPGAVYRSLGEIFENGMLTIEFEAVK